MYKGGGGAPPPPQKKKYSNDTYHDKLSNFMAAVGQHQHFLLVTGLNEFWCALVYQKEMVLWELNIFLKNPGLFYKNSNCSTHFI
jgi:hypothetical protein